MRTRTWLILLWSCVAPARVLAQSTCAAEDLGCQSDTLADEASGAELADAPSASKGDAASALEIGSAPAAISSSSERPVSRATLAQLLARYAHEPSVSAVVQAAIRAAGNNPERFVSMARRARLRGLVPTLELGARRGQAIDLHSAAASSDTLQLKTDDNLVLQATLRFELGRLLFASEEVSVSREARWDRHARSLLIREVVRLYFLRKRLLLERDLHAHTDIDHEVRIAEAEALLDAFTNQAFSSMMRTQRSAWTTGASTRVSTPP